MSAPTGVPTPFDDGCPGTRHGTRRAYEQFGCRCEAAKERMRLKWRRNRPRIRLVRAPRERRPEPDLIAVERAVFGDQVPLTIRERAIAVERLTAQGLSARAIAERLGIVQRSVVRYRNGHVRHGLAEEAA